MPVVKGGVWTNIEDEILKASVSKYGLNQWARVSSLLARKTPKQCKARWSEWLDPGIRKVEWSRDEDEKLLHLAKLMPTQWRTIAPIVGRTATQCLERYQRLLDEAEAKEAAESAGAGLGLGGPEGGESQAPSADDVRRLRPGELDPDPESKPARPDTIDLDEDEKEMLSEARARLANTQGKKAKRKARERQLEESRRLAVLQKRRELKSAGINVKVTTRKKGQMDYNADVPFEKAPAPGFYDTQDELAMNERAREAFDPRKQQLANKRKGDQEDDINAQETKRRKPDGNSAASQAATAAAKAAQAQKVREAERSSKRRGLVLPAPQVSEAELEDIVKMGMSGERASSYAAEASENDATRGLVGSYSNTGTIGATPLRTPRAPQEEDRIANELHNARARTATQSVLLGGENTPLHEGGSTTGYEGVAPSKSVLATPNPMATPLRNGNNAATATVGATPLRTPRDNFSLNQEDAAIAANFPGSTPRDIRLREQAAKGTLRSQLASLPQPKDLDFELELPEEQDENALAAAAGNAKEDAAIRDARAKAAAEASARADFERESRVVQRGLPRPRVVDYEAMLKTAKAVGDPVLRAVEVEMAELIAHDAVKFGGANVKGKTHIPPKFRVPEMEALQRAQMEVVLEMGPDADKSRFTAAFAEEWEKVHSANGILPGLAAYTAADDEDGVIDEEQHLITSFDRTQDRITAAADRGAALEKKLAKVQGGYFQRQKVLRAKIGAAAEQLGELRMGIEVARQAEVGEEIAVRERMEGLREEVRFVGGRERQAQEVFRERKVELEAMMSV